MTGERSVFRRTVDRIALVVLTLSLIANAVLIVRALRSSAEAGAASVSLPSTPPASAMQAAANSAKSNPADGATDAKLPEWSQLQSEDPASLMASLRAAGFSEPLVRAAVETVIRSQFALRERTLLGDYAKPRPYWKSGDDVNQPAEIAAQRAALHQELQHTMVRLFGPDGATPTGEYRDQWSSVLNFLPADKIEAIARIEDDYSDMEYQARSEAGRSRLPEDADKLALLRAEKAADVAALLTPEEFELYELHRSRSAQELRSRLRLFEPTEQEFRAMLEAQKAYDARVDEMAAPSPTLGEERMAARQTMEEQLKAILGEARYAVYERETNAGYHTALRITQHFHLPAENAIAVFELARSMESRRREYGSALLEQARAQLTSLLTAEGLAAYRGTTNAAWLNNLERSAAAEARARASGAAP